MATSRSRTRQESKAPIETISLSAGKNAQIQASIWANDVENGGDSFTSYSVTIVRRYRDGEEWKSSQGFRASDLLLVAHAAQKAFDFINAEKQG